MVRYYLSHIQIELILQWLIVVCKYSYFILQVYIILCAFEYRVIISIQIHTKQQTFYFLKYRSVYFLSVRDAQHINYDYVCLV